MIASNPARSLRDAPAGPAWRATNVSAGAAPTSEAPGRGQPAKDVASAAAQQRGAPASEAPGRGRASPAWTQGGAGVAGPPRRRLGTGTRGNGLAEPKAGIVEVCGHRRAGQAWPAPAAGGRAPTHRGPPLRRGVRGPRRLGTGTRGHGSAEPKAGIVAARGHRRAGQAWSAMAAGGRVPTHRGPPLRQGVRGPGRLGTGTRGNGLAAPRRGSWKCADIGARARHGRRWPPAVGRQPTAALPCARVCEGRAASGGDVGRR